MAAALPYVAAIISAASSISQSNAQQRQERYDMRVADQNARRAEDDAKRMRQAGAAAEQQKRIEIRRALGRSSAAAAQAGIGGAGYGSAGLAIKQASAEGEYDASVVRFQYGEDATAREIESWNQKAASTAARRRARGAKSSGWLNTAASALSGYAAYSRG